MSLVGKLAKGVDDIDCQFFGSPVKVIGARYKNRDGNGGGHDSAVKEGVVLDKVVVEGMVTAGRWGQEHCVVVLRKHHLAKAEVRDG